MDATHVATADDLNATRTSSMSPVAWVGSVVVTLPDGGVCPSADGAGGDRHLALPRHEERGGQRRADHGTAMVKIVAAVPPTVSVLPTVAVTFAPPESSVAKHMTLPPTS